MTVPVQKTSFVSGEIAPSLFGMIEFAKVINGCSVLRNMFPSIRGGVHSRGGLANIGRGLQTGTTPNRLIPFKFNAAQQMILEFSNLNMRIIYQGAYVTETTKNITAASGNQITVPGHGYSIGDWFYVTGTNTNADGRIFPITNISGNILTVQTILGVAVNITGYSTGGTAARIYTVTSPYADVDLQYIKYTQSADRMSLTCVNASTGTEYPPYDLLRYGATNWVFSAVSFQEQISAPTNVSGSQSFYNSGTLGTSWVYAYCVTSVNSAGQESVASPPCYITGAINIAVAQGTNTIKWRPVSGAAYYNVYRAQPSWNSSPQPGTLFGFCGQTLAPVFNDPNISPDYTVSPPTHQEPFSRNSLIAVTMIAGGSGYSQLSATATFNTASTDVPVLQPVEVNGYIAGVIISSPGSGLSSSDTITFGGGAGSGAKASIQLGPSIGTYPSVVNYHQQRRWYANSTNNPDTYWASKPGDYENMDSAIPVNDSDALSGSPWATQVNGIQWLIPMPGSLLVATSQDLWQLTGAGGSYSPITPANQQANRQTNFGFSGYGTQEPIVVDWHILYVEYGGFTVRQVQYNYWANIFTGLDISFASNHLFKNHQVLGWAWASEPDRIVWAYREDGKMLSLTYLPDQEVITWARHDTNGKVVSMATVNENGYDIVYMSVQRTINGTPWYFTERLDPRQWTTIDNVFCLDAGRAANLSSPISSITNADHLEGQYVTVVIDDVPYPNLLVTGGTITLPVSANNRISYGLGYTCQVQGLHAVEPNQSSIQGKRKRISSASVRVQMSRGFTVGANQPVASITDNQVDVPWTNMATPDFTAVNAYLGETSLYTGDVFTPVDDDWHMPWQEPSWGMLAVQQTQPFPLSVLSYVVNIEIGDSDN